MIDPSLIISAEKARSIAETSPEDIAEVELVAVYNAVRASAKQRRYEANVVSPSNLSELHDAVHLVVTELNTQGFKVSLEARQSHVIYHVFWKNASPASERADGGDETPSHP